MDQEAIVQYVTDTFPGVEVLRPDDGPGAGDTFFYAAAQRDVDPSRRLPFATIVTKDYTDWDEASRLDRPGVFRLNIGVDRDTFVALFHHPPTAEATSGAGYDFAALDCLMPHPTYAPQSWVCVLSPSPATFKSIRPLLAEAYELTTARHTARGAVVTNSSPKDV